MTLYNTPLDLLIITRTAALTEPHPDVYDTGVIFTPDDYDFRTHTITNDAEREHVRQRTAMILRTLVLHQRPDLSMAKTVHGWDIEDLIEWQFGFLDRHSHEFTQPDHTNHNIYLMIAVCIIDELSGEVVH